jgi:penicillin-insensitive murein endopeptidase
VNVGFAPTTSLLLCAALSCYVAASSVLVASGCGAHDEELAVAVAAERGVAAHGLASPAAASAPAMAPGPRAVEPEPPRFPLLPGEHDERSRSLGDTSHGRLHRGRRVEESVALGVLPRQRERELRHATDELATLLEEAAAKLHAETRTRLWIGNLARDGGGDIAWSVSHNSGRDADVAFAYRAPGGSPVDPPDLVRLPTGTCSTDGSLCLDVPRTWAIVRALVSHPEVQVQYVFVSEPIKRKLLAHAEKAGERGRTLERARELLRQPVGAAAHDDHLHVRVYCSEHDLASGCVDTGPVHAHVPPRHRARHEAVSLARATLAASGHAGRAAALARLALLREPGELERALASLADPDPELRHAAALYVGLFGGEAHVERLVDRFGRESDPAVLARLVDAVGELGGPLGGAFLRDLVAAADAAPVATDAGPGDLSVLGLTAPSAKQPATPRGLALSRPLDPFEPITLGERVVDPRLLRALAIEASAKADRLEPLGALLEIASSGVESDALRAASALERITNHPYWSLDRRRSGEAGDAHASLVRSVERWRSLARSMGTAPRSAWLVRGFVTAGYEVRALDAANAWELVRAVGGGEASSYNARRVLASIAKLPAESLAFSAGDACRHHLRHFSEHRRRYRLGAAPPPVRAACARAGED